MRKSGQLCEMVVEGDKIIKVSNMLKNNSHQNALKIISKVVKKLLKKSNNIVSDSVYYGKMNRQKLNYAKFALLVIGFCFLVFHLSNVSQNLNNKDAETLNLLGIHSITNDGIFSHQIEAVKWVQQAVFLNVKFGDGLKVGEPRSVERILAKGSGLCYDRSRIIELALKERGFTVRHVFILFDKNGSFVKSLFSRSSTSHAASEVLTSRGWMFVDSVSDWLSINTNQVPVCGLDIYHKQNEFIYFPPHLNNKNYVIHGVYSRNGYLYPPFVPIPDLNYVDFVSGSVCRLKRSFD